jgi:hypothetical protein
MRSIYFLIYLAMLVAGCAPSTNVLHETSENVDTKPVSIQEAFRDADKYRLGTDITVAAGQVPLITLDNNNLLVIPIINDGSKPHTMKVMSYVTRKNDGSNILFYPVLSFVDQNFRVILTVKPKYEFKFNQNVLTNEFDVPAGIERIIIRTDQEFIQKSFEGTTSAGSDPSGGVYGMFGALGGVVGVLTHSTKPKEEKPFKFDGAGVVSVETN